MKLELENYDIVGRYGLNIRYFYCHFRWRFQQTTDIYTVRIVFLSVVYPQVPAPATAKQRIKNVYY